MKHTIIHIVVLVLSLLIGTGLSAYLNQRHNELLPEKYAMRAIPLGGLHKFAADVEWMLFVNYMGSIGEVNEKNADEVTRRLERLISLDPNLERLYRDGVTFLAFADPEKTIEMLKKACENPHLAHSAEIPFYVGFFMTRNLKEPDYNEAAKYFMLAARRRCAGDDSILANCAMRRFLYCKAKALAQKNKIDERLAMAEVLYKLTVRRHDEVNPRFQGMLLEALRDVRTPDAEYTPTKAALDRAREIARKVFADSHFCENCLNQFGPGQKFCTSCGKKVSCYGVCKTQGCSTVVENLKFCPNCGKASGN